MRYAAIQRLRNEYHIRFLMCWCLQVSRSGYQAWRGRGSKKRAQANSRLLERMRQVHTQEDRGQPVVLHSDHSTHFTCEEYQQFLAGHNLVSSMGAAGHCGDDAATDGFFGVLERERVNRRHYHTIDEARSDGFDYIERFCNPRMRQRLEAEDHKLLALTQLPTKME